MIAFRKISPKNSIVKECAKMIQKYSWGPDYPVNAWDEIKQSNLLIGAFDEKKLVGCASINKVASPDKIDNSKFWFADAVVLPEY